MFFHGYKFKGVVPRFFQISIFVINTLMMGMSNKIKKNFQKIYYIYEVIDI